MKKLLLILSLGLILSSNANSLDFNSDGNPISNKILKDFIPEISENTQVISHFYDINNDGKKEILGIVKCGYFYSLEGYKLFVLKENNSDWEIIKSDVYFDNSQDFSIKKKKITFHKTIFYKNKKCKATIKKDKITTKKSFLNFFNKKKAQNLEEITKFCENHVHNDFKIENFHAEKQKTIDVHYKNLDNKTKHYLELK